MTKFTAYATTENFKGNPIYLNDATAIEAHNEDDAIEFAQGLTSEYPNHNVYIFAQNDDGATGFINPNGFGTEAINWADLGK